MPAPKEQQRKWTRSKKSWRDMETTERVRVVIGAIIQYTLLVAALRDLRRRSPDQIKGPKRLWYAICFVNYAGPVTYFLYGRRRQHGDQSSMTATDLSATDQQA